MPNMSYCRFENTLKDLKDCERFFDDLDVSTSEEKAKIKLLKLCQEISEDYGYLLEEE